jgi:PelA/Pel-15E family pectate lyase
MTRSTAPCLALILIAAAPAHSGPHLSGDSYGPYAGKPDSWFATDEGRRIADNILSYQLPHGGWSKGMDTVSGPHRPGQPKSIYSRGQGTFDDDATTSQMWYLSRAYNATHEARYREGFLRGVDYILKAQYPSGGWPQVYPLASSKGNYRNYVTFNDDAMTHVMEIISATINGSRFESVDAKRMAALRLAFEKGLDYILKAQIKVNGRLTAWCQQHDPVTYEPRPGRTYEHVALTSAESADILAFLISLPHKTPAIERAIKAGAAWLRQVKIDAYRRGDVGGQQGLVADPGAHTWARFYEIGTNRPIFSDRDGVIKYSIEEIGLERRNGYAWYTNGPDRVFRLLGKH